MTGAASPPALPPADADPATVLCLPGAVVTQYEIDDVVADAIAAVDPDLVVATDPERQVVRAALVGADRPVVVPGSGFGTTVETAAGGDVVVVLPPQLSDLPPSPSALLARHGDQDTSQNVSAGDGLPNGRQVVLITDALELAVDPTRRETRLEGRQAYCEALDGAWCRPGVTHVSIGLRPGHRSTVTHPAGVAFTVVGAGTAASGLGAGVDDHADDMTRLDVYPGGAVRATALPTDTFGLRGLDGVSDARATRLRRAGYTSRDAIANAPLDALTSVRSIGAETAATIRAAATATAEGTVVPLGDASLPSGSPLFIDIETDGLSGSTAWLVGVLDGGPETGDYLAFRERHPDRPADHLEAFVTWLLGAGAGRPVVAWNGYRFDFPVIRDQLQQHCPAYVDDWDGRYQFDPLHWAARQHNAALPGRTNQLAAVATALGYTPQTHGLDGKTVADIYAGWRGRVEAAADPASVQPPDWDRLEAYCEDDVRALATVYEALRTAARRPSGCEPPVQDASSSHQGSLSDFS